MTTGSSGKGHSDDFALARIAGPVALGAHVDRVFADALAATGLPAVVAAEYMAKRGAAARREIVQGAVPPGEERAYIHEAARRIFREWEARMVGDGALRGARRLGASSADAEDIAQNKMLEQWETPRPIELGKAGAFGAVAGKRAAIDAGKRSKKLTDFDEDEHAGLTEGSGVEETERKLAELVAEYRAVLSDLPKSYRNLLVEVGKGVTLNELAERNLEALRRTAKGAPRTFKQARNNVDVQLGRALKRVRQLILERRARGMPS